MRTQYAKKYKKIKLKHILDVKIEKSNFLLKFFVANKEKKRIHKERERERER